MVWTVKDVNHNKRIRGVKLERKTAMIIVIIAVVVAAAVLSYIYFSTLQPENLEIKARNLVEHLQSKKFDEAYDLFNDQMVAAISVDELETGWNTLINQVGQYQKILGTRIETENGYKVIYVSTEFEEATLNIKVVFDSETKIAGLWFEL